MKEIVLEGKGLKIGYGQKTIVPNLDVCIEKGTITSLIGPNGCGKSTLLKALARVIPLDRGEIELFGEDVFSYSSKAAAKKMALLPQAPEAPEGLSVEELVSYGRFPHKKGFGSLNAEDHALVEKAMKDTGVWALRSRTLDSLSGGQRQRAWIAMALAQDTPLILLDEPTTYLDMAHQLEILELLERLNEKEGKTIVLVIHDLNLAARFSDHMIAMKDGAICYEGSAEQVMTRETMANVFSLDAYIVKDPWSNRPTMLSYRNLPDEV